MTTYVCSNEFVAQCNKKLTLGEVKMKAYKIALLSLALVLPVQELLADSSSKAKPAAANKQMVPIGAGAAPVSAVRLKNPAVGVVDPSIRRDLQRAQNPNLAPIQAPLPNLTVAAIGWDTEICVTGCPAISRDLHIAKTSCKVKVRIKNASLVNISTAFTARLTYATYDGRGAAQRVTVRGGIGANEVKEVVFDVGYHKTDRPFTITLDYGRDIAETNEGDNTASFSSGL